MAIPAKRGPIVYTQPDGSKITIMLRGDEFSHSAVDMQGNPLTLDERGFYVRSSASAPIKARKSRAKAESRRKFLRTNRAGSNIGEKKVLVLLVNFSNKSFKTKNAQQAFHNLLNQEGYSVNGGTGSVRDFYLDNSHGQFSPVFDVYGPYDAPQSSSYYGGSSGTDHSEECLYDVCVRNNADIDFSQYDNDKDGVVDMILYYFAGYDMAQGASGTIWSHQYSVQDTDYFDKEFDGVKLGSYFCTSELNGTSGTTMCAIGTTCHEFAHSLGLPDFYDTDYEKNGESTALSYFSTMDSGAYLDDGRTPPYFNIEERIMLGWLDAKDALKPISTPGPMTLDPVNNDVAYYTTTSMDGEYFIYECRDATGWDSELPGGLLVYHADKSSRKVKIYIQSESGSYVSRNIAASELWSDWESTNAINENASHPCFYVVPAAKQTSLTFSISSWEDLNKMVFPGSANKATYNAKDWNGALSAVTLKNIAFSGGKVSFDVSIEGDISEDPSDEPSEDPSAEPAPSDPDIGYNYIVVDDEEFAGDVLVLTQNEQSFFLRVRLTGRTTAQNVEWFADGKAFDQVDERTVAVLKTGSHTVMAKVTFSDGTYEIIEQEFKVE